MHLTPDTTTYCGGSKVHLSRVIMFTGSEDPAAGNRSGFHCLLNQTIEQFPLLAELRRLKRKVNSSK